MVKFHVTNSTKKNETIKNNLLNQALLCGGRDEYPPLTTLVSTFIEGMRVHADPVAARKKITQFQPSPL